MIHFAQQPNKIIVQFFDQSVKPKRRKNRINNSRESFPNSSVFMLPASFAPDFLPHNFLSKFQKKVLTNPLNCDIIVFAVEREPTVKAMGNGVTVAPATLTRIA